MTVGRRVWRRLGRIGRKVLWIYLVVALVLTLLQKKLIFIGAETQGTSESQVSPPAGSELVRLRTAEGTGITGLFGKATEGADAATAPTVIWFYGNAMCMNDALQEFKLFRRLGANVMLVDYAGYGMSGGNASEQGCYAAAEAGYRYLLSREDIDRRKIVAAGWSLGGAVAIDLAARHAEEGHICGVMTFCTFTSMVEMGQHHYPIFPVRLMLTERFESEGKMAKIHVPVLMGHGCRDSIVPFGMCERLAKACGGRVRRFRCDEADHDDFFDVAAADVEREVGEFLRALRS
ncbi:MAG TPA: alpha/beta hydrolase [Phycisphaerae bacterium]|nr:alpha/beta hydrolase [Phycisphaerae bacterium]